MTVLLAMLLLVGPIAVGAVSAQTLRDPTQPPVAARASAASAASADARPTADPVLHAVLIAPDRRVAIISGRRFDVGDLVGDSRIIRITETEVLLRSSTGQTTLKLFPQVSKRTRTTSPGAGASPNSNKKSTTPGRETEA